MSPDQYKAVIIGWLETMFVCDISEREVDRLVDLLGSKRRAIEKAEFHSVFIPDEDVENELDEYRLVAEKIMDVNEVLIERDDTKQDWLTLGGRTVMITPANAVEIKERLKSMVFEIIEKAAESPVDGSGMKAITLEGQA